MCLVLIIGTLLYIEYILRGYLKSDFSTKKYANIFTMVLYQTVHYKETTYVN